MEKEMKSDVDRVKDILSKVDPMIAVMAVTQSDVDSSEVNKIKEFLAGCKPESVKYAIAELDNEIMVKEVNAVSNKLKKYDKAVKVLAVAEMGLFKAPFGLCADVVTCIGTSIYPMRCGSSLYARFLLDEMIQVASIRGARAVVEQAKKSKEM